MLTEAACLAVTAEGQPDDADEKEKAAKMAKHMSCATG
jgi:hypothetical protein